ncbi:MAG: hypothetical protein NTY90_04925 [Candidatus Micrarchaeota archaeon]|nr:hypothetical protein [Candidatus Micrarchaeota archaeon]
MVSVYVKALFLTLLFFAANFFLIKYLDDTRADSVSSQLATIDEEMQSSRILLFYIQTANATRDACPALEAKTMEQLNNIYGLARQLEEVRHTSILSSTEQIKRKYILTNSELWLYVTQLQKYCSDAPAGITPILYFYPDKRDCVECRAQAEVLDKVRDQCVNVRIFAFPTDLEIGVLPTLMKKYGIEKTPSLVINEKKIEGIVTEEIIRSLVPCTRKT